MRTIAAAVWTTAFIILVSSAAAADVWPSKPVKMIIGYPPGGGTDLVGRLAADHLSKVFGQPFVVENKPGAAGNLAGEFVVNAPADGYTLSVVGQSIMTVNSMLYKGLRFDAAKDFVPITLLVRLPVVLEVYKDTPVKTYAEFIDYVKKAGTSLNHGSPGIGTLPHLAGELFKQRIGFQSVHVPYRGSPPFAQGMTQGELQWSFDVANFALQLSRSGAVRLLAVSSPTRHPSFPDVPTFTELGVKDSEWSVWFGLVAKTGTPKDVIDKIAAEVGKAWSMPENVARIRGAGFDPAASTPEEAARFINVDRALWSKVVRDNNIQAQ
ncbi:MAG: Bug family tripartite tricarboxylate transporter substrate binding protein [Rhodospirillales bacterium]